MAAILQICEQRKLHSDKSGIGAVSDDQIARVHLRSDPDTYGFSQPVLHANCEGLIGDQDADNGSLLVYPVPSNSLPILGNTPQIIGGWTRLLQGQCPARSRAFHQSVSRTPQNVYSASQ